MDVTPQNNVAAAAALSGLLISLLVTSFSASHIC